MQVRNKTSFGGIGLVLSVMLITGCSKKNDVTANIVTNLETSVKENLKVDATSVSFETAAGSKVNSFVLLAPTSHGSKQYYITGKKADASAANAFVSFSEISPVTEQSLQEETDALNLVYKNTKQQVVHIRWDDGQTADFTVKSETAFSLFFPEGSQKLTDAWKSSRSMAVEGIKSLVSTINGLRVNADKPLIQ